MNLARNHEVNQSDIAHAGGIAAIVAAMKSHTTIPQVQHNGCGALLNLSRKHERNQLEIITIDGITTIVATINMHKTDEAVQEKGCEILWSVISEHSMNDSSLPGFFNYSSAIGIVMKRNEEIGRAHV